jgi:adenosylcobyric acid synthase
LGVEPAGRGGLRRKLHEREVDVKLAPAIMVQGTASSVGKSLVATALCRLFRQDGLRVAPFKAQNMALNAFVTPDGGEIGRAQAAQAEAAGVAATVDMNPILLKPEGDRTSQVVVLGKPIGRMAAAEYHRRKPELRTVVADALLRLRQNADLVVIEGAGSPAEINLKAHDIVNMSVAKAADARVLLVGDIDRGGVFAAFVGTMELLDEDERARIAAFVINKFRGDPALLTPGLEFLAARTGVPTLGVLPFLPRLTLADEDSIGLDDRGRRPRAGRDEIEIAVVRLPRISNFDDFQPLEHQAGVVVRFIDDPAEVAEADLVVLPGSKSTVADLTWLRATGFADEVLARATRRAPILGICGGCQMLGQEILDPHDTEAALPRTPGLGLLPFFTQFATTKVTAQVRARPATPSFLTEAAADLELSGFEIHMGHLHPCDARPPELGPPRAAPNAEVPYAPSFAIVSRNGISSDACDGAVSPDGNVVGTLLHGLFENTAVTASLLDHLRRRRGLPARGASLWSREAAYDRLAEAARQHFAPDLLHKLAGRA